MIQDIKLHLLENNTGQVPGVKENPRDLTGDGFAKAKQSIKDFPEMLEVRTLVAVKHGDRFVVIGGNQRLRAMRDLDYDNAPVMVVDWTVGKINEFIIKDNVEYGVWNFDLLANEWDVQELMDWGLEVNVDLEDINDITEGLTDENEVPEILPNPKSKIGDVWICGNHRVMCGDSTSLDDVSVLMAGSMADLLITDPPYNVAYEGGTADALTIMNDNMSNGEFRQFLRDVYASADSVMRQGAAFYIWHADSEGLNFRGAAADVGWQVRQCLIWNKNAMVLGRQDYHWKHEPCLYGWKDGAAHYWGSDRSQTTVLDFNKPNRNGEHPTMKPVELFQYQIENSSKQGGVVLDLFGGSGTTVIACEKSGRDAIVMELDPKYCDVIIKRWQDFTGKDAILESTQQKFNEL